MGWTAEQMIKMDGYRAKYTQFSHRAISKDHFDSGETHLPTWEYTEFLEQALVSLEKKNMEMKK